MVEILVVDDFAPFRHFICSTLQLRAEFQITEAVDGLEAVQKAEERQPELILLDINLPKLNGLEAAVRIRNIAPHARILFVSQESSPEVIQEAFRRGGEAYVQKSAALDLLDAIDAVLRGERFASRGVTFNDHPDARAPQRHEILFCSDEAAIIEGVGRFVAAALSAADGVIALLTESHRHRICQELRARGEGIEGAIQRGTCVALDADEAPDPARFLEAVNGVREAAVRAGKEHPRVAFCGERAGRLWAAGRTDEALQLEQFCGELADDVDILCIYPRPPGLEDDQALTRICAEHTAVSSTYR